MKRCTIKFLVVTLIALMLFPTLELCAIEKPETTTNSFINVDSSVSINSEINIKLDLTKISYTNYNIEITSSYDITGLQCDGNIEMAIEGNVAKIYVDDSITEDTINLKYSLPEGVKASDVVEFKVTVTDIDSGTAEEFSASVTITDESSEENPEVKPDTPSEEIKPSIDDNQQKNNFQEMTGGMTMEVGSNEKNSNSSGTAHETTNAGMSSGFTTSGATVATVTYNGDSNNYLSSLEVNGYSLNTEFAKEKMTYFINVTVASSLEITATPEDEDAIVCIYGNENISFGSKILISVTAENGNVRTYRIFVN